MWHYTGRKRPDFAVVPSPDQESVWDYPRPPELAADSRRVEVLYENQVVASSSRTLRVLETASPPSFYIPNEDVNMTIIKPAPGQSVCEWKGVAAYWALSQDPQAGVVGWSYPDPAPPFEKIRDCLSFYPAALACYVSGERVCAQPGGFYGGWVTSEIVGPFKGEPGTGHW